MKGGTIVAAIAYVMLLERAASAQTEEPAKWEHASGSSRRCPSRWASTSSRPASATRRCSCSTSRPFAYAAQRYFRHLILEANLTPLLPIVHGDSSRQILSTALVSVLVTRPGSTFPVYLQVEGNSITSPGGRAGSRERVYVGPEIFVGPFATPISDGTRLAAGVSFNAAGAPVHGQTFTVTASFDIPNRYGY